MTASAVQPSSVRRWKRCATGVASGEIETVLVWSIDRLSRNFAHQIPATGRVRPHRRHDRVRPGARQRNAPRHAVASDPVGHLRIRAHPNRRALASGQDPSCSSGLAEHAFAPPYGYRLIRKTETCGARLEVDDTEACVVRRIYDLHVRDGLKMHEIGPRLDAQGVRRVMRSIGRARPWPSF